MGLERAQLQPVSDRPPYPYLEHEWRKVARDGYVSWQGSRYSVRWRYAGREVSVRMRQGQLEVHYGGECVALHAEVGKHQVITRAEHHRDIPFSALRPGGKTLIHIRESAPVVEARPLAAYERAAAGGGR